MILSAVVAFTYPLAIQFKRGGVFYALAPFTLIVWALDVVANYTEWSLIFGWPEEGQHTITARVKAMHTHEFESRRNLAKAIQVYLDACEPDGEH